MKRYTLSWIAAMACLLMVGAGLFYLRQTGNPPARKKLPKLQRIEEAFRQEFEKTKDLATGEVPRERLLAAMQYAERLLSSPGFSRGAIAGVNWAERGPKNVAGRTRAILVDANDPTGNTIWAGGVGGGLWKTTNAISPSPTWSLVDGLFENVAITCIAQDPPIHKISISAQEKAGIPGAFVVWDCGNRRMEVQAGTS
ncbi:MAG: hypothetical protein R3B47_03400 [Bacteroidia bacterium]